MDEEIILERFQDISIKIPNKDFEKLSALAEQANQTENKIVNAFIEYGLKKFKLEYKLFCSKKMPSL